MSVKEALVLRAAVQQLIEEAAPRPLNDERRKDRAFALTDALCYELADRLIEEMAGGFDERYVRERLAAFWEQMLVPFTLAALKERAEQLPPVGRA